MIGQRVVCIKESAQSGLEVGFTGTINQAAEYLPGWDAGMYSVTVDEFPEKSPYGHRAVSYWTEPQMLEYWEYTESVTDVIERARKAQQANAERQKHDVQLEIPATTLWANERELFERRSSVWYDGDELAPERGLEYDTDR